MIAFQRVRRCGALQSRWQYSQVRWGCSQNANTRPSSPAHSKGIACRVRFPAVASMAISPRESTLLLLHVARSVSPGMIFSCIHGCINVAFAPAKSAARLIREERRQHNDRVRPQAVEECDSRILRMTDPTPESQASMTEPRCGGRIRARHKAVSGTNGVSFRFPHGLRLMREIASSGSRSGRCADAVKHLFASRNTPCPLAMSMRFFTTPEIAP